ncbi:MAG: hypothetical protein SGPRY_006164, partial [Prymnesium sp.]
MGSNECGSLVPYMMTSEEDRPLEIILLLLKHAACFFALWLLLSLLAKLVLVRILPKSQDAKEDSP